MFAPPMSVRTAAAVLVLAPASVAAFAYVAEAAPAEPNTSAELERRSAIHFAAHAANEWGAVWDRLDEHARELIGRDEFIQRMAACHDQRGVPLKVESAHQTANQQWVVWLSVSARVMELPAAYEGGRWVFPFTPSEAEMMRQDFETFVANCQL